MKLNVKHYEQTHEGGQAPILSAEQTLQRSVMSCLLWENEFYEDGQSIVARIKENAAKVSPQFLSQLAIKARNDGLRHVPLMLASIMCGTAKGAIVSDTVNGVIQRADELAEFVAVYANVNGVAPSAVKKKLSAQAKKGLAKAFGKFNAYALAKYNRDGAVKLRDVLFLCHAKAGDDEQAAVWKKLIDGTLESPDTWEVALSGGADKKETFTRLLKEGNLGYLALLRNLRNMLDAGVDETLIKTALLAKKGADKVLPFRYVAAARHAPRLEAEIDAAMQDSINALPKLKGKTVVLIDVSGSMASKLAGKSDMTRQDAAAALGSIVSSDSLRVFTFSSALVEVPARRGMAGVDAVLRSQPHSSTELKAALHVVNQIDYDRLIVITDEQSSDGGIDPRDGAKGYMINVASNKNGVGYGRWVHIDGFSENVIKYIYELEQ